MLGAGRDGVGGCSLWGVGFRRSGARIGAAGFAWARGGGVMAACWGVLLCPFAPAVTLGDAAGFHTGYGACRVRGAALAWEKRTWAPYWCHPSAGWRVVVPLRSMADHRGGDHSRVRGLHGQQRRFCRLQAQFLAFGSLPARGVCLAGECALGRGPHAVHSRESAIWCGARRAIGAVLRWCSAAAGTSTPDSSAR